MSFLQLLQVALPTRVVRKLLGHVSACLGIGPLNIVQAPHSLPLPHLSIPTPPALCLATAVILLISASYREAFLTTLFILHPQQHVCFSHSTGYILNDLINFYFNERRFCVNLTY